LNLKILRNVRSRRAKTILKKKNKAGGLCGGRMEVTTNEYRFHLRDDEMF
jgi:hypothetical protein